MKLKTSFLNWRPDADDHGNDGLTVADNLVHDSEGYKPVYLGSAGSFSTTGGLNTVTSIVARPVGPQDDLLCAWLSGNTLYVGLNGVTATTGTTGYPLSFSTAVSAGNITHFDACELEDRVFFVVRAEGNTISPNTGVSLGFSGYMDL